MPEGSLSTQQFVEIKEVKDGVVYLKSGGLRKVMAVSGVNFDLKSGDEQEMILGSFQRFINTIDFSVQFFVHSRKVNVDDYLKKIEERKTEENNELIRIQIDDYILFIKSFIQENPVISKGFFVVIPYDSIMIANKARGLIGLLKKRAVEEQKLEERAGEQQGLLQLNQRVDEVVAGLESIGLQVRPMEDDALMELFYNLYNPRLVEKKDLGILKKTGSER